MERVVLGRTGLSVSRLALGGLFVSKVGADLAQGTAAVHRAFELGINYVDTAPGYADSEEVLGQALAEVRQPVILSTKLGGRPQPFKPQDVGCLRESVKESLRLLRRETIDLLMIHEPDRPGQYAWWNDWERVTGPVLELLADLKREGVIRHTGLGGTTAYEMAHLIRSGKFDVVLTAFNYSLLWREAEVAVIPAAQAQGMGIVVGSPLQQGALARPYREAVANPPAWLSPQRCQQLRQLYALVDDAGLPLAEVALRWVLSNPAVHTVLMGARSAAEVEQNVAAANRGPLPPELLRRLDAIAAQLPCRPYGEPFGIGWLLGAPQRYQGPGVA
jgi:aryl-alcohol dehydrogenase-like predicted oxidoreductase